MTVGASSGINTLKEPFVNKAVHDSGATSILTDLAGSSGLSCKIFCLLAIKPCLGVPMSSAPRQIVAAVVRACVD
jgi:hypothetical protein